MGIFDFFDAITSSLPFGEPVDAESAPVEPKEDNEEQPQEDVKEESEEKEEEAPEEEAAEEEEEEEEEDPEDPKEKLEEECRNSNECKKYKSHYEACAARVEEGAKEDCIEEFFELAHCATACAAPKLWKMLK